MNWDKARRESTDFRRELTFGGSPILIPAPNTFSGVVGGAAERLALLEQERRERSRKLADQEITQQRLQAIQRSDAIKLLRTKNKKHVSQVSSTRTKKQSSTHKDRAFWKKDVEKSSDRKKANHQTIKESKTSLLLNLVQTMTKAIERGDMHAVANLASEIYGESF